ncbi:phosphate ABC transporter substrate-binding protein, PhoT family [Paludibacter propionicigenes WB4]|uniref:Phosphate ABC transporter substrate-binding protein, PhoT family n=1 Tax=Paludibacter propionicigenes (strain DSM 17365 / JCM 13257 / WB4) TaxID=694427 RepID=E4T3N7_PALPW|nr:substrate-binding domain-containing protein [Paludibacter propionicigenes]ADQ79331.1 phosphate ABC transporter substrate-binding protein, PhoT family [Paludibacter propionicigenes WB4]
MIRFKLLSFFFILFLVSCQPKVKDKFTDTYTEGVIPIAVDENFKPIIQEEVDVFEAMYPKAGIVPHYTNEVDAINLLLKDSVRFVIATRPLSSNEELSFKSRKFSPRSYKLATDGIALIINNHNPDSLISVDQIKSILTGKVTNWKDIYPKSKLGKFQIVFDNKNSSTVRYAIDSICRGQKLASSLSAQNTNPEVIDYVSKTPNAIGVIGVNWLGNEKDTTNLSFKNEIRVMSVSSEEEATTSNSYKPFQAYLFYGYYPFTRTIYVIVNDPRGSMPSSLTSFMTGDRGQRIILKSGLVPATQPIRIVNIKDE